MKRYMTDTDFVALDYSDENGITERKGADGNKILYKNRASAETYCKKHKCLYVERKFIFYK
jgi:hypothetical protein